MQISKNKVLFLTGASTKIGYIYGILKALLQNGYKPKKIYCTSATALIMLHIVLQKWQEVEELIINFSDKQIFGRSKPLNNKGKPTFTAIWRSFTKKNSLGKQSNLFMFMQQNISKNMFETWKYNRFLPEIIVYAWNGYTKQNELFNLRDCEYLEALNIIEASSNIPVFINPKYLNGVPFYDGGSIVSNIAPEVLKTDHHSISEIVSIWNRKSPKDAFADIQKVKLSAVLKFAFDFILKIRIPLESLKNEELQEAYCKCYNISSQNFYTYTEIDSQYDNEKEEKQADIKNGYNATLTQIKKEQ